MKTLLQSLIVLLMVLLAPPSPGQGETPLRVGESLKVSVLSVPAADIAAFGSTMFTVGNDGTLRLPHIGEVKAAGLTPSALSRSIESAYKSAQIYTRPIINVSRGGGDGNGGTQQVVTVSGNVKASGPVMWRNNLRLIDAISEKGGFDDFANKSKVKLIRGTKETVYDMKNIAQTNNVMLQPGDIVHVPQGGFLGGGN